MAIIGSNGFAFDDVFEGDPVLAVVAVCDEITHIVLYLLYLLGLRSVWLNSMYG